MLRKLFEQDDKRGHFMAGFGAAIIAAIAGLWLFGFWWGLLGGLVAALGAGIAKEIMDSRDPAHHTVDFWDFIATFLGGFAFAIIYMAVFGVLILTGVMYG